VKPKGLGRGLSALLPDITEISEPVELLEIPIREIKPNPFQPRRDFTPEELNDLARSIEAKGVIQPLIVRQKGSGYELVAGERRLRAAKSAGLKSVPVRLVEIDTEADMLEMSLIENLQRQDLNPVELAEGYRRLQQQFDLTQETIAGRVGKERATVANTLRILELPEPILISLRKYEISMGHAKAILSLKGTARRSALWKRVVVERLSVRQTEEAVRISSDNRKQPRKSSLTEQPLHIRDFTDRLRRVLGTKIRIQLKGKKGFIRIEFYSSEDLERIVDMLEER